MTQQLFSGYNHMNYMYGFYYNIVSQHLMPTFQCKMIFYNQFAMAEKVQNRPKVTSITVYQEGTIFIL